MSLQDDLKLFQSVVNELLIEEKENPVASYIEVDQLDQLDLKLEDEPISQERFSDALKELVLNTPRTSSKAFFNQLFGGRKSKAVLGDLLAVMLNNSMYTYKVGGPQIEAEKEIIRNVIDKIGYTEASGGTIAPGGSMSNMMGMIMARDHYDSNIQNEGVRKRLIAYTSKESHYSIPKNAAFTGIGRDNVRYIDTDEKGKMDVGLLEEAIKKDIEAGYAPFLINATIGTTVLGAYDSLEDLSVVSEKYNIWLHADGAYGGAVLFSDEYKHLIKGVEKTDSFCFNAHKMLGVPLSCSLIFAKDKQQMYTSFSNKASYLYQDGEDDYNPGKISIQCGRRNDALKFWALWKAIGTKGLTNIVETEFELADNARNYVKANEDYELYSYEDSISVCFNYKGIDPDTLCTHLYKDAELMVGYGIFKEDKFVRLVFVNSENTKEDVENFFKKLEQYVAKHPQFFPESASVES